MAIKVVCDICGEPHKVGENRIGKNMRCRSCDQSVKVPRGPFIDDDEELVESDEDGEEDEQQQDSGLNWFGIARDGAGAVFGLILMGFYIAFTLQALLGNDGSGSTRTSQRFGSSRSTQNQSNLGGFGQPANRPFQPPNVRQPHLPKPPRPNFPQPPRPNVPAPVPLPGVPAADKHEGHFGTFDVESTGRIAATGGRDNTIHVWSVTGLHIKRLEGHTGEVGVVQFTPDGTQLLSLSSDGTLRAWQPDTGTERATMRIGSNTRTIAISADSSRAAVTSTDRKLHLVDLRLGRVTRTVPLDETYSAFGFVNGERQVLLVAPNGKWQIMDVQTGAGVHSGRVDHQGSMSAATSTRGQFAIHVGGSDVELFDAATGQPTSRIPVDRVTHLEFSPDGLVLGVADTNSGVVLCDPNTGRAVAQSPRNGLASGLGFHARVPIAFYAETSATGRPRIGRIAYRPPRAVGNPNPLPMPPVVPAPNPGGLQTDDKQPIVITSITPQKAQPGAQITIRGKGFTDTSSVVFADWRRRRSTMGNATYTVVSDTEITATVPSDAGSVSIIEIHTPEGTGITWPSDSQVLTDPGGRVEPFKFALIRSNGDATISHSNVLVDSNASVGSTVFSRVYIREGGHVANFRGDNGIVSSTKAKPMQANDSNKPVLTIEVYPSYLPKVFNQ